MTLICDLAAKATEHAIREMLRRECPEAASDIDNLSIRCRSATEADGGELVVHLEAAIPVTFEVESQDPFADMFADCDDTPKCNVAALSATAVVVQLYGLPIVHANGKWHNIVDAVRDIRTRKNLASDYGPGEYTSPRPGEIEEYQEGGY